jgi:hypothetical protein
MTRHKATQTGLGTPSPLDRWINAMLRGLAMLMSHAASIFCSMRLIRHAPECHSDATPEALPCRKSGKLKETTKAAASSKPASSTRHAIAPCFDKATRATSLPRAGEVRRALRDQRANSGGGPPSLFARKREAPSGPKATAPPVPNGRRTRQRLDSYPSPARGRSIAAAAPASRGQKPDV